MRDGRGWVRTSSLLCVRQALSRLSYSPVCSRSGARDRTSISTFRAWCPASLDDPGANRCKRPSVHPPHGRSTQQAGTGCRRRSRLHVTRGHLPSVVANGPMLSMPLAYPSTLDHRLSAAQREVAVLRGGALEPDPCSPTGNSQAKADANSPMDFQHTAAENLSLSGGASIRSRTVSS